MAKATINNKYNKEGTIWKSYHKRLLSQTEMAYKLISITQWKNNKGTRIGHRKEDTNSSYEKCKDTEISLFIYQISKGSNLAVSTKCLE